MLCYTHTNTLTLALHHIRARKDVTGMACAGIFAANGGGTDRTWRAPRALPCRAPVCILYADRKCQMPISRAELCASLYLCLITHISSHPSAIIIAFAKCALAICNCVRSCAPGKYEYSIRVAGRRLTRESMSFFVCFRIFLYSTPGVRMCEIKKIWNTHTYTL